VYDKGTLDDLSNQAENFVVVSVGEALRRRWRARRPAWYDQRNAELWKLAQDIPRIGQRYFERLLFERDPQLRARLAPLPPRWRAWTNCWTIRSTSSS
jgi:hypothetical protein